MLWESADPSAELARRFGFTDAGQVTDWLTATIARHWGIRVAGCERVVISAGNALAWIESDVGRLIAKWCVVARSFPKLARQARIRTWLDERGQPVSAPIRTVDGHPQLEVDGVSIGLQRVVDGTWLDVTDPDQVHNAGVVLAELHTALAEYPADQPSPEPDKQLVHNDYRAANILCAEGQVVAVLDFEEVTYDHRVADLAHAMVMLATRFRNWGPTPPDAQERFLAGYQSVRPLSPAERARLPALVSDGEVKQGWSSVGA